METKERPILFSAPMVQAILAGHKTQTRRIVKPQPDAIHDSEPYWNLGGYRAWQHRSISDVLRMGTSNPLVCPYGEAGDLLWVRETWAPYDYRYEDLRPSDLPHNCRIVYLADYGIKPSCDRFRPSIHMPRWASRITLEITGIRVERLQQISEADAIAEGSYLGRCECLPPLKHPIDRFFKQTECHVHGSEFRHLWSTIHKLDGPNGWAANPLVWTLEFKRAATA